MTDNINEIDEVNVDDAPNFPPRPQSPFSKTRNELKEAFPDVSENVVRAVLVASAGEMEPAFVGLLALNDATIRPVRRDNGNRNRQLEEDERIARQMAEQYDRKLRHRDQHGTVGRDGYAQPRRPPTHEGVGYDGYHTPRQISKTPSRNGDDLRDDLEEFREDMQRRIHETSKKVGNLFNTLKDRITNELNADKELDREDEYPPYQSRRRSHGYSGESSRASRAHSPHLHDDSPRLPARPKDATKPDVAATTTVPTTTVNAFGEPNIGWEPIKPDVKETAPASAFGIDESDEEQDEKDEKDEKDKGVIKVETVEETSASSEKKDTKS